MTDIPAGPVAARLALIKQHGSSGKYYNPALLRNEDVPRLIAAVEAVLKRHAPIDRGRIMHCCRGCEEENERCCHEWPCPTYEAISRALLR